MQRFAALKRLSNEHHRGLVIARRAREPQDDPAGAWVELRRRFADALEPHFQREEHGLLRAMQDAGERTLVERTAEHRAMRVMINAGGPDDLAAFAKMLADHIRFEESELFETAQRVLAPDALAALQDLHDRQASPACGPRKAGTASPG